MGDGGDVQAAESRRPEEIQCTGGVVDLARLSAPLELLRSLADTSVRPEEIEEEVLFPTNPAASRAAKKASRVGTRSWEDTQSQLRFSLAPGM